MNISLLLLRLYPRIWRDRYEEEFLVVLASRPFSLSGGLDVICGALDAHLHPHLGTVTMPSSERMRQMFSTLRASLLTIFCAYGGVVLAGMGFQKMTESPDFRETAQASSIVGISFHLVVIGALGALMALLVGGLPIALAVIRSALARKQRGPLFWLAVPVLAFVALLGTLLLMKQIAQSGYIALETGLFFGAPIATTISSASSICFAVTRSEISEKFLCFALPPFLLATISMALVTLSTLVWGIGLHESAPQLFTGNNGLIGWSTIGTWLGIVITMVLATALAAFALMRGLSARFALHNTASE